ncbi:hypothetical protein HK102_006879, partial [Quaeritorhiza haematococci]
GLGEDGGFAQGSASYAQFLANTGGFEHASGVVENLYAASGFNFGSCCDAVSAAVDAFAGSPGHRSNVVNSGRVGCGCGSSGGRTVVVCRYG